jgi:hypothetical protein
MIMNKWVRMVFPALHPVAEGERRIEGVTIHTHLVRYDEDVDFGE